MTTEILETLMRLLAAVFVGAVVYVAPKLVSFLKINGEAMEFEELMRIIQIFAQAADQLLKADDPTGEKRMKFVLEELEKLGYEITDSIISMIEGSVWEVNKNNPPKLPEHTEEE